MEARSITLQEREKELALEPRHKLHRELLQAKQSIREALSLAKV